MSMSEAMAEAQRQLAAGPPVGSRWKHFKGGTYRVVDNLVMESDLTHVVYYVSEEHGNKIGRPLAEFTGMHPGHGVKRFERLPD